ncbi:MAG: AMP-binding protein, partial [bacterium]|nr:AMP-binding protein [bacterium]
PGDVILQKTTFTFDVSVWELFWWSLQGASLCLLEPGGEKNPGTIVEAIEKNNVTVMHFVPSMLNVFLQYLESSGGSPRLTSLARVFASGEALELQQVRRFNALLYQNNQTRLVNLYGPTEATIDVSYFNCSTGDDDGNIPIGKPIDNTQLYILDPEFRLQPVSVAGQLCIGGVGLARGYINNPRLTAGKFVRDFQEEPSAPSAVIYQTGDLARWLEDGNIEFLGRIDHQVKIRGFRIELGEIESRLLLHPHVRGAVVLARPDGSGDKHLCAYVVPAEGDVIPVTGSRVEAEELKEYLSQWLPHYMVPSFFVEMDGIPLTPSGKVDRKALPAVVFKSEGEYIPPRDGTEEKLALLWRDLLEMENPVGIDDNFFQLGGHSLKAAVLTVKIHKQMNTEVPLAQVFKTPTIRELAKFINAAGESVYAGIRPIEKRDYYPQSSAQKRLFFLDHFENIGTGYNMPSAFRITGDIKKDAVEDTLKALMLRHETLRTSFHLVENQPVQKVHLPDEITFETEPLTGTKETGVEKAIEEFIRPFDLGRAPLLRVGIEEVSPGELLVLFDIHHIVADGTSMGILTDDFVRLYAGLELPFLGVQYKEFSHWQNDLFNTGKIREQEKYWQELYKESIPRLNLYGDYPRPDVFRFDGDSFGFSLEEEESLKFKTLNPRTGATLFMKLLAVFNILLHKYTAQEDIVIGSGAAGRNHSDLDPLIGMFVNTLAVRNFPGPRKTWPQFLAEVKHTALDAFENQDVQFEELVDRLEPERDPSRNPIIDVSLVLQNFEPSRREMKGIVVSPIGFRRETTKFDMTLFVTEGEDRIYFSLEYCSALFKKETIRRFSRHLLNITRFVNRHPETPLADIDILTTEEKRQLLFDFNESPADSPRAKTTKTIHRSFSQQLERTPHHIAVVLNDRSITYCLLDGMSTQLARYLYEEKNTRPGQPVGILMDRSIELVIVIMGILKAGGAYVPLDPGLPNNRIKGMIHDAHIGVVVSQEKYVKVLNQLQWECSCFHTFLCMDRFDIYEDEEKETTSTMDRKLWEYIGETADDDITGGGWISSYTGLPIPSEEMAEYGDNILKKLTPLLHPRMRILEIGCASGLSMYRIAPKVGLYYGTDLSSVIIERNRERVGREGHQNIKLECLAAYEVDKLKGETFDLVIINSVIQGFHSHNYLRQVIAKSVDLLDTKGLLFVGDVMDLDLKQDLIRDMMDFKAANRDKNYTTKTKFSEELFISRRFFEDMAVEIPHIRGMEFTRKIHTIENELTKFRYDALLSIDKEALSAASAVKKHKYQHELTRLRQYKTGTPAHPPAHPPGVPPQSPVYIIYTSGTTGIPRGVVVEHKSLVNYINWRVNAYGFGSPDAVLQLFAPIFDGYPANLFSTLLTGGKVVLVDSGHVLDSFHLNKVIRDQKVTNLGLVPSMLQVILEGDENRDTLKRIRWIVLAGERTGKKLLQDSRERYPGIVYINEYGPTETTVGAVANIGMTLENIDIIGTPLARARIYILFIHTRLEIVPAGVPGELCIAGPGVSRGYLNNPQLTEERFLNYKLQITNKTSAPSVSSEVIYKTGDRARWLVNGSIEFLGRVDHQVKVRGYRIELGEIQTRLAAQHGVKDSCVILRDDAAGGQGGQSSQGSQYICAYIVFHAGTGAGSSEEDRVSELNEVLAAELPDYMIPSHFVQLERIPRLSSGKLDIKSLPSPAPYRSGEKITPPRDETERKLAAIWAEVLEIVTGDIGIDHDFFKLGGHSLRVTVVAARIHKEFNVNVPLADLFSFTTIRDLAQCIKGMVKEEFAPVEAVETKEYYPLSSAQKRIFLVQQMDPHSIAYNTPESLMLEHEPHKARLEETFGKLIRRHENLRTSFEVVDEEPVQRVHDPQHIHFSLEELETRAQRDRFVRPFDLSHAPLMRAALFKQDPGRFILMIDLNHIVTDGTSQRLLGEEFLSLHQ